MNKPRKFFLNDVETNTDYFELVKAYLQTGEEVEIVVERQDFLNTEFFIEKCKKFGELGCGIVVYTKSEESVFTPEETDLIIKNFNKAQPFVRSEIKFFEGFNLEQAVNSSKKVNEWVDEINNANCLGQPLSSFEKYIYCYQIATQFAYNIEQEGENSWLSRSIPLILDPKNDKICCVGFSSLLTALCKGCGVKCESEGIDYYNLDYGHQACTVNIKDEKYGLNHIFRSDPTFGARAKFGSTLAGIWRGYSTINTYYTNQYSSERQTLGIAGVSPYQKVLGKTASEINLSVNSDQVNSENFEQQNYVERLKMITLPLLDNLINKQTKEPKISHTNNLEEIQYSFLKFCEYYLVNLIKDKERELAKLHTNNYITAEQAQEQFEQINNNFNQKVSKGLEVTVGKLIAYGYTGDEIKNFFETSLDKYQLTDADKRLIKDEQTASKNYLFNEQVKQQSADLNIQTLALAIRNTGLAQGFDIINACKYSASLIARSALTEFEDLADHNALGSSEVFVQVFSSINKNIIEEFLTERDVNIEIMKRNENIPLEQQINSQNIAEQKLLNELSTRYYQTLIEYSFTELLNNPKLLENYSILFEQYPHLVDLYESNKEQMAAQNPVQKDTNNRQNIENSNNSHEP